MLLTKNMSRKLTYSNNMTMMVNIFVSRLNCGRIFDGQFVFPATPKPPPLPGPPRMLIPEMTKSGPV